MPDGIIKDVNIAVHEIFVILNEVRDTLSRQDENIKILKEDVSHVKKEISEINSNLNQNSNRINLLEVQLDSKVDKIDYGKEIIALKTMKDNFKGHLESHIKKEYFTVDKIVYIVGTLFIAAIAIVLHFIK